jgi:Protein of unknown function (DUF2726)
MTTTLHLSTAWLIAAVCAAVIAISLGLFWAWRSRQKKLAPAPLPKEWSLAPRPVFSADERRIYRLLREAFTHHVVLSKLPLVRFCQPNDPEETRYWYDLLGAAHVTFAVCSPNGRVLAAVDLTTDRGVSRRSMQIKQAVLSACRVRYLRCSVDNPPSLAELQLLVPQAAPARAPQPAPLSARASARRDRGQGLWRDSSFFQDSFFAPEPRLDSGHGALDGGYETSHLDRGPAQQNSDFGELSSPGVRTDARPAESGRKVTG